LQKVLFAIPFKSKVANNCALNSTQLNFIDERVQTTTTPQAIQVTSTAKLFVKNFNGTLHAEAARATNTQQTWRQEFLGSRCGRRKSPPWKSPGGAYS